MLCQPKTVDGSLHGATLAQRAIYPRTTFGATMENRAAGDDLGRFGPATRGCFISPCAAGAKRAGSRQSWGLVLRDELHQQHAVAVIGDDPQMFDVSRQFDRTLKFAVRDFHRVSAAGGPGFDAPVAAPTAHRQMPPRERQLLVAASYAGEVEFHEPAGARPVNIDRGRPVRPRVRL